jgi:peptidoglycan/xylan/chitin deacetylase (PgdA/CDA1 family)
MLSQIKLSEYEHSIMFRGFIKTAIANALHTTKTDQLLGTLLGSRGMPTVIGYHRVAGTFPSSAEGMIPSMFVTRRTMEKQLDWLGRYCRFVSLDELGARLEDGSGFSEPTAAVTFDDGYSDVYYNALPLLKRKGIPAAVFVVTDHVNGASPQVHDKLYLLMSRAFSQLTIEPEVEALSEIVRGPFRAMRILLESLPQAENLRIIEALENRFTITENVLRRFQPLSWQMLLEMQAAGMTIGSHTKSHALLTNEIREVVLHETSSSRQELERRLGTRINHFAYPDGRFNPVTVEAVASSGYRYAYTICQHRDPNYPLLTIPRMVLWENSCLNHQGDFSFALMSCQMNRVFDLVRSCGRDHRPSEVCVL